MNAFSWEAGDVNLVVWVLYSLEGGVIWSSGISLWLAYSETAWRQRSTNSKCSKSFPTSTQARGMRDINRARKGLSKQVETLWNSDKIFVILPKHRAVPIILDCVVLLIGFDCFESLGNLGCAYHPFVCTLKRSMVHNFRKENHQKNILTNLQMVNSQVRMIKFCIQE